MIDHESNPTRVCQPVSASAEIVEERPRPAQTSAQAQIRPFTAADADDVARLLVRMFQKSDAAPPAGMAPYLRRVYLDAPWFDPEIASRVAVDGQGHIIGFAGVIAQPMMMDGRRIRVAFTSSLAVDNRAHDPTIAGRLLRDIHNGPQDLVLSDRANTSSTSLSLALKGEVAVNYSLDWLRVLRPAGFAIASAAQRFRPARLLAPFTWPIDNRVVARTIGANEPHWAAPTAPRGQAANFTDRDASHDDLLELIPQFITQALRPDWSREELDFILTDAAAKRLQGDFVARLVQAPSGRPVGAFLYHLRKGEVAHLTAILAAPGREGNVLDRAIAHATTQGAVAIRGRAQPPFMQALMERRAILLPELSALVYSRNPEILRHFREGTAFFTGLSGEHWMRLNGDRF